MQSSVALEFCTPLCTLASPFPCRSQPEGEPAQETGSGGEAERNWTIQGTTELLDHPLPAVHLPLDTLVTMLINPQCSLRALRFAVLVSCLKASQMISGKQEPARLKCTV